jgi:hypothetical protein
MTKAKVKQQLLTALAAVVDGPLRGEGFVREEGTLLYSRRVRDAEQDLLFSLDYFPTYEPGAEAHIHPMVQLRMPVVTSATLGLVHGDAGLLAGAPDLILNQPIELCAPNERHQRWFASGQEQFSEACELILAFLGRWVLPFVSTITTPEELVSLYESSDRRPLRQRHWYAFIAGAYHVLGRRDMAQAVVREHFRAAGVRKRYASLLESLGVDGQ